jgi:hypothetical protein
MGLSKAAPEELTASGKNPGAFLNKGGGNKIMPEYTETGNLVSMDETAAVMRKIATNYNGCRENGTLPELLSGKWSKGYHKLVCEAAGKASQYVFEAVTQDCLLNDKIWLAMRKPYESMVLEHQTDIRNALREGNVELLQDTIQTMHEKFMDEYFTRVSVDDLIPDDLER